MHTPRFGCTFRIPIVDFTGSTGTLEFKKSTLGAPDAVWLDFDLVSSFLVAICKQKSDYIYNEIHTYFIHFEYIYTHLLVNVIWTKKKLQIQNGHTYEPWSQLRYSN